MSHDTDARAAGGLGSPPAGASPSNANLTVRAGEELRVVKRRRVGPAVGVVVVVLLSIALIRGFAASPNLDWSVVGDYLFDPAILDGVVRTIVYTVLAMIVAIAIGLALAVMRLSTVRSLRGLSTGYIWFFRGIPTLVLLLLFYNLALAIPELSLGLPFTDIHLVSGKTNDIITPFVAAVGGLALAEAAYMSEIIRGGLLSIDKGQHEAAASLGMTSGYTLRRIVLPQALRIIVPPTGNETIAMLKGTALVSVIAAQELLTRAQFVSSENFRIVEMLFVACFWYLVISSLFSIGQGFLERRLGRGYGARPAPRRRWVGGIR